MKGAGTECSLSWDCTVCVGGGEGSGDYVSPVSGLSTLEGWGCLQGDGIVFPWYGVSTCGGLEGGGMGGVCSSKVVPMEQKAIEDLTNMIMSRCLPACLPPCLSV